ncbi:ribose-5-phosphate isomerase RpiA [uncultured Brevundimonas sp.]|uniref:ribose-5-phosphate isomerase RpiA n=1 Tax=uncultured Brevundimonas sp. TaxID=213418 RepID=UPI0030EBA259|tara:strand:+ start:62506 stop:63237 length:732 start_codon:yes stop_codon:yes gene_type:complete
MSADDQKRAAGEAAAAHVEPGMVVGLGTGSTAAWFVKALAARKLDGLRCVPTSEATADLARELGLTLSTLEDTPRLDLTVDGTDEVGPGLALIKGGGAALLREKLVWEASNRCLVIADAAKVVKTLGKFALPIEVVAFGHKTTANRIADVLADHDIAMPARLRTAPPQAASLREASVGDKLAGVVRTDGGNVIYDAACGAIHDPARLASDLKLITGVVEHGLFLDLADLAIIGGDGGVEILTP